MLGKKWKLLFTILAVAGLGLTSCTINGEPQGGGDQQGDQQPADDTPVTPAHEHTYQGYQHDANGHWQVCTGCQEATAKQAHTGGSADCLHKAVCSVCGTEYGELGAHNYGQLVARVAPTCEEDGLAAHYQCSVCHKYFTEEKVETTLAELKLVKTGHNVTAHPAKDATCEEAGNSSYYECTDCHKFYAEAECQTEIAENSWVIKALGHSYGELIAQVPATCTETGMAAHYECSRCHKLFDADKVEKTQEQLTLGVLGHDVIIHAAQDATCTEDGNSGYYECNECHKYFSDEQCTTEIEANSWVIPAKGHDGVLVPEKAATCEEAGYVEHYKCSRCNKLFAEATCEHEVEIADVTVVALGHSVTVHAAQDATCTEVGNSQYYECSRCHKYFSDEEGTDEIAANSWVIEPAGHDMTEHAANEATCTAAGNSKYYECGNCHKYFSDEEGTTEIDADSWIIPAKGHNMTEHAAQAATCTAAGNSKYYECQDCGKFFSDEEGENEVSENSWVIAPTSHTFDVDYPEIKTLGTYRHAYHHCSECDKLYMAGEEPGTYVEIADDDAAWENALCQYNDTEFVSSESNPYILKYDADILYLRNHTNAETNDTFAGKFLKMVNDIDLGNNADNLFGVPIGGSDTKPFSGTFDGNGYTISNIYISRADAVGLFSRVTDGTVKNLKLENVNFTTTNQRTAGLVARASGATIENVEILSGILTGVKENGGIIAVALAGCTVTNCINRANLTATEGSNGGIVGYVYNNNATITGCANYGNISGGVTNVATSGTAINVAFLGGIVGRQSGTGTLTIKSCFNEGNITLTPAAGIGVGGIFGANFAASQVNISTCSNGGTITGREATGGIMGQLRAGSVSITECINEGDVTAASGVGSAGILGASIANNASNISILYSDNFGNISGSQYVGGIAGLPRKSTADSEIKYCNNYGDITGSSSTGIGGIIGIARINVRNCACYAEATIMTGSTGGKASTLNAIGGASTAPGYITALVQTESSNSNGAEAVNCYLVHNMHTITITGSVPNIFADGARIYVWAWNGTTSAWYRAFIVGLNQIKVYLPDDITGMKVVRLSTAPGDTYDDSLVWNATGDITIVADQYEYTASM